MKNIILTGMMGSGKTTCGMALAGKLCREFVDTDHWIEEKEDCTISQIFENRGESYFRSLETEAARLFGKKENLVIATGGGMVLRPENAAALKVNGIIVFLDRKPEDIFQTADMSGRPLAGPDEEAFVKTYRARLDTYLEAADIVVQNDKKPEETVAEIMEKVNRMENK